MDDFNRRLVNKILDTFEDGSREDTDEWRRVWLDAITDAMEGKLVYIPVDGISSQIVRKNADAIANEVNTRFEAMKEKVFAKATENLVKGNPARMEAELRKRWDARIEAQLDNQRPQMLTEVALQVAKVQQQLYDEHITAIKQSFENTPLSELQGLLNRTAAKMGLAVVPRDEQGQPTLQPTVLVPDSQDTHMGGTPLSPQRTVDKVDKLIIEKQKSSSGGVASSVHNPAHAMAEDIPEPTQAPSPKPPTEMTPFNDLPATPENALLKALLAGVNKMNDRMVNFEHRLQAAEGAKSKDPRARSAPITASITQPPTATAKSKKPAQTPQNCALPAPAPRLNTRPKPTTAEAPQPPALTEVDQPPTAPQQGPPPPIPPRPDPTPGEMTRKKAQPPARPTDMSHMSLVGKTRSYVATAQLLIST